MSQPNEDKDKLVIVGAVDVEFSEKKVVECRIIDF